MGFTGNEAAKWREKYISLFNSMETRLKEREDLKLSRWKQYIDRGMKIQTPKGYFCVFKEIDRLFLPWLQAGLPVSYQMVPDLSVGITWSKHWETICHDHVDRVAFNHYYPDDAPQAKSNPQRAWAYSDSALPEFRRWLDEKYIPDCLPKYLKNKSLPLELVALAKRVALN